MSHMVAARLPLAQWMNNVCAKLAGLSKIDDRRQLTTK
jgi:hypothetical protein